MSLWNMPRCSRSTASADGGKAGASRPPVRVYREGRTYRIALAYRWGAVLTATLYRNGQGTWAELPERVQVAYDEDNERLVLASEGVYVRDYKEYEY